MADAGTALMGIGNGVGENRAQTAARTAISSPLLETSIEGAKGMLFNIVGGTDLTMSEVNQASEIIARSTDADANIIFGASIDESLVDQIKITVVATGFDETRQKLKELSNRSVNVPLVSDRDSQILDSEPQIRPSNQPEELSEAKDDDGESDEFDIPAFLRQGR
jgi:cell division protein FtsZ